MTLKERFSPFMKPLAYALIAISTLSWTMVFVIPFLDFSVAEIAGIITVLIIIGEVTFYIAILLLGKPLWEKMKNYWLQKIANHSKD